VLGVIIVKQDHLAVSSSRPPISSTEEVGRVSSAPQVREKKEKTPKKTDKQLSHSWFQHFEASE
jgi:hypothetical protein